MSSGERERWRKWGEGPGLYVCVQRYFTVWGGRTQIHSKWRVGSTGCNFDNNSLHSTDRCGLTLFLRVFDSSHIPRFLPHFPSLSFPFLPSLESATTSVFFLSIVSLVISFGERAE